MIKGICLQCGAKVPGNRDFSAMVESPYDLIIAAGAGYQEPPNGIVGARPGDLLNFESRMRLDATGILANLLDASIMTTGGKGISEKWGTFPALAELGAMYLEEKHCPRREILLEDQSDATHGNLALGLRIIAKEGIDVSRIAVISSDYHLQRIRIIIGMMGLAADLLPAEGILLCSNQGEESRAEIAEWLVRVQTTGIAAAELAKISDPDYWERRREYLRAPLNRMPPHVDITADVAATRERLQKSGASDVQTSSF